MNKHLLVSIISLWISALSYAHDHRPLSRQGLLGVMPASPSGASSATVAQVLANSTGEALGLMQGDKILTLNTIAIRDFAHLVTLIQSLKIGDKITANVLREGKNLTLTASLKGRPEETSKHGEVIYDTVYIDDGRLRSIAYKPHHTNNKPSPAVFFIQGYTCGSVDDGMFPRSTTGQMTEQWVQAGFVVYKVEKYAVGDSQTRQHCHEIGFDREVDGFLAALTALKQYPFVDANQVYLFGHSLGVLVAPILASKQQVAGVSGYGGVVKSWLDYTLDIYSKQSVAHFNVSPEQANRDKKRVEPFMRAWLASQINFEQLKKTSAYETVIKHNLVPIEGEQIFHRHYSFFREVNQHDFRLIWSKVNVPVLMIHGSLDIQAINSEWAFDITDIVNQKGKRTLAQAVVIDNAEHAFMHFASKQAYRQARSTRTYRPSDAGEQYATQIGQQVIDWIRASQR